MYFYEILKEVMDEKGMTVADAMAGKFHHILAGIAVGRTEKQGHALVKGFFPVHEMPEQRGVALSFFHLFCGVGRAEHPGSHSVALCAGF